MKVKIEKGIGVGEIDAPPSKSYAHRLMICGALAEGQSKILGISTSADMEATLNCMSALGVDFTKNGDSVLIKGGIKQTEKSFDCHESGSTLRFFIPIALTLGCTCKFTGTKRLMQRGIDIYEQMLGSYGVTFLSEDTSVTVSGKLKPNEYFLPGNVSSQYISGLLFALPLLNGDSVIRLTTPLESAPYVDITIECLRMFGVEIKKEKEGFFIKGNQKYKATNAFVEGDWSNSAFLEGFNVLGGDVSVFGLNESSLQGDKIYRQYYKQLKKSNPTIDISSCPDLGPVLFALAASQGGATFTGTKRLKIKESDRAEAMKQELAKLGVNVHIYENSVTVGCGLKAPKGELFGHNDHRIVMALSLVLTLFGGVIDGCEAVEKSYPNFFEDITKLGIESEIVK